MKRFYVFFVLVFVLMLFGCKKSVLHRADSGKTFTYSLGEEFSISLSENLSTGYTWHFKTIPATQMVVSFFLTGMMHRKQTGSVPEVSACSFGKP